METNEKERLRTCIRRLRELSEKDLTEEDWMTVREISIDLQILAILSATQFRVTFFANHSPDYVREPYLRN